MKNKLIIIKLLFFVFLLTDLYANNLEINSSEVKFDKKNSKIIFRGNVKAVDENNNILKTDEANYSKEKDLLKSVGSTIIETGENYVFESNNVIFDNINKISTFNLNSKLTFSALVNILLDNLLLTLLN